MMTVPELAFSLMKGPVSLDLAQAARTLCRQIASTDFAAPIGAVLLDFVNDPTNPDNPAGACALPSKESQVQRVATEALAAIFPHWTYRPTRAAA